MIIFGLQNSHFVSLYLNISSTLKYTKKNLKIVRKINLKNLNTKNHSFSGEEGGEKEKEEEGEEIWDI